MFLLYTIKSVKSNLNDETVLLLKMTGIQVTSVACCASGIFEMGYACNRNALMTCTNADEYVFWDAFHPTQKTSSIISSYLVKHALAQFL
jgi:phospholipase/lecithinase/hemolysin